MRSSYQCPVSPTFPTARKKAINAPPAELSSRLTQVRSLQQSALSRSTRPLTLQVVASALLRLTDSTLGFSFVDSAALICCTIQPNFQNKTTTIGSRFTDENEGLKPLLFDPCPPHCMHKCVSHGMRKAVSRHSDWLPH
jgi:hypothetical protein